MRFSDYLIKYNSQFGLEDEKTISLNKVDLSEDALVGGLMDIYISMLKEKIQRKKVARNEETFELSGMSESERYMFDSLAGLYIYENQFDRKELQEEIAEATGLSMAIIEDIAVASLGEIKETTKEEKEKVAKIIINEEQERSF